MGIESVLTLFISWNGSKASAMPSYYLVWWERMTDLRPYAHDGEAKKANVTTVQVCHTTLRFIEFLNFPMTALALTWPHRKINICIVR